MVSKIHTHNSNQNITEEEKEIIDNLSQDNAVRITGTEFLYLIKLDGEDLREKILHEKDNRRKYGIINATVDYNLLKNRKN